ncbi:alcohol dehydrogenase GroES-like domain-containing protein [Xylaria telfairii]|nr:alcohol dehydrogenase GroES-like domain-containing protein [Xylaria telfairii]
MSLPKTYKQAAFKELGGPLVIETVPLKMPASGEILVKVEACGVCHSEVFAQNNVWGAGFPVVPGHEIIGRVAAVGDAVQGWSVGQRIGGAWHGGHDGSCELCKQGLYQFCQPYVVNGVTKDGGYAEYCIIRAQAAIRVADDIDAATFAPMLCAGCTVFSAIKAANLKPGATIAVQGLGGLGHMAVQFGRKMGFRVVAISRGRGKEASVRRLGAHEYIDSTAGDPGEALQKLGSAQAIFTTAMETAAMVPLVKGLGIYGKLVILSFPQSGAITVDSNEMMMRGNSVHVSPVGTYYDAEETIEFARINSLKSEVETFPLDKAQEAFEAMLSGKVRYRAVITMD